MSIQEMNAMMTQNVQNKRIKNKFTIQEDATLQMLVRKYGEQDWSTIARALRTKNSRQCHDRWFYYLSPKLNRGPFTEEEDNKLIQLEKKYGQHWVKIAKHFSGRTDTQIKNRWNVLKRKLENDKVAVVPQVQPSVVQAQVPVINQSLFENIFEFGDLDAMDDPFAAVF